jgi:hypothetical protein
VFAAVLSLVYSSSRSWPKSPGTRRRFSASASLQGMHRPTRLNHSRGPEKTSRRPRCLHFIAGPSFSSMRKNGLFNSLVAPALYLFELLLVAPQSGPIPPNAT